MAVYETEFSRGDKAFLCVHGAHCEEVRIVGIYIGACSDSAPMYDAEGNLVLVEDCVWYFVDGYPFRVPERLLGATEQEAKRKRTFDNIRKAGYM